MVQYQASCHCSSVQVQFAVHTTLEEKEFKACDCKLYCRLAKALITDHSSRLHLHSQWLHQYLHCQRACQHHSWRGNTSGLTSLHQLCAQLQVSNNQSIQSYSFAPHNRKHKFCPKCGSSILIEPNDKIEDAGDTGINLRTVEGINLSKLKIIPYDGRSRDSDDEMKAWAERKKNLKRSEAH